MAIVPNVSPDLLTNSDSILVRMDTKSPETTVSPKLAMIMADIPVYLRMDWFAKTIKALSSVHQRGFVIQTAPLVNLCLPMCPIEVILPKKLATVTAIKDRLVYMHHLMLVFQDILMADALYMMRNVREHYLAATAICVALNIPETTLKFVRY